ncbi:MAG: blue light sensor protein [Alteromonas sp.]|nr:blue light sensor protein [Alteromonas sp.]MAY23411.1 blue light sensor protein [Flavobacteriaceae bacterium]|tara:strand:- start:6173 stop:6571 length:399 start_codon:yes stop_codon:yes gene_type:complete
MPHSICYVSNSAEGLNKEQLEAILNKTYTNNSLKEISGILLHSMGHFFQVIEGDEDEILSLYEKIKVDNRHHNIFEVMNKPREKRFFEGYATDFKIIRTSQQLKDILLYLEGLKESSTADKLHRLLQPFIID